jgi:hypothetical protein
MRFSIHITEDSRKRCKERERLSLEKAGGRKIMAISFCIRGDMDKQIFLQFCKDRKL